MRTGRYPSRLTRSEPDCSTERMTSWPDVPELAVGALEYETELMLQPTVNICATGVLILELAYLIRLYVTFVLWYTNCNRRSVGSYTVFHSNSRCSGNNSACEQTLQTA